MSKTTLELITKVGVPLVVINGTYSSLKLLSNDDYNASFLSGLKTALTVSLLIASGVTSYVLLILLEIVWNYYKAYYLFETTNTNEKLKSINSEGFKTSKNLINFIGENYDENKEYFDTALRNELSFFKSSLFGYKLDKEEIKSHQKVKTVSGYEINFYAYEGLKIPKVIADLNSSFLLIKMNI
jgi:hypothetical protein